MAYEQNVVTTSLITAADLSAKQFYFCKVDSSGYAALCSAAGEEADGVIYDNGGTSGRVVSVAVGGIVQVICGGTITAGNKVTTNSSGKAVAATAAYTDTSDGGSATDPLIGSYVFGKALASGVSGDIIPVLVAKSGAVPTTAI